MKIISPLNVSQYQGTPPHRGSSEAERKIDKKSRIYDPSEVIALLQSGHVHLWTKECRRYVRQKLNADQRESDELLASRIALQAITNGRYLGSEWCDESPSGPAAACEAYLVNIPFFIESTRKEIDVFHYVKFAIAKTGKMILMISCHLEKDKPKS